MCASKKLLAAAGFKEAADIKARVGLFKTVRNIKREALTLFWLHKCEASLDGVCNQLKIFAAHNNILFFVKSGGRDGQLNTHRQSLLPLVTRKEPLVCCLHLNNKNGFLMVKVFFVYFLSSRNYSAFTCVRAKNNARMYTQDNNA